MNKNNEWAVVTGVSKGLGFLYAEELLKKGYNILGVARDTTLVTSIIKKYPDQKIVLINCDLAKVANVYTFYEQCQNYNVTLVINNAGFGVWGTFCKTDLAQELNMIALNIATLHILTKLFLKKFIVNNNGRIINIASLAALTPGPGFSSYYASKAYVLNLSVAINTELKLQKLRPRVITICPGPLKTDF